MHDAASIQEKIKYWSENKYFDAESRRELASITDPNELEDRFYTDLAFGTGGMRGVLGAGTNRMNRYIVRRVSQGLADTIREQGPAARGRGVVIAYDSRRYARDFALETALVLAANGVTAYLFDCLRPTPELSFAIRHLQAMAGVNITASHNPKEYNGYKVYGEDGSQLSPEASAAIVTKMAEREDWEIYPLAEGEARAAGLLRDLGEAVDRAYEGEIVQTLLNPELTRQAGGQLKIVFTPLHGSGGRPVQSILQKIGFTACRTVPQQAQPDPEFATVQSPNPEDPAAFALALTAAREQAADLVLATDPDADRLGAYARDRQGQYCRFTGNQIGVILEYYLLSQRKRRGILPDNGVVVKTVASTDLGDAIAQGFGVQTVNVLVGFKYIGEQIKAMEAPGVGTFLFGFEESHGYLAGTYARDKDAVQAAALLSEAALYYQQEEGKTLPEVLAEIFRRYGTFLDEQVAITLPGKEGRASISKVMQRLRAMEGTTLAGVALEKIEDFQNSTCRWMKTGRIDAIELPVENVLRFSFVGGGFVMARPSGTEPKIRFYFCLRGDSRAESQQMLSQVKAEVHALVADLL